MADLEPAEPEDWVKVTPYLDQALGMAADVREAWLESLTSTVPGIVAQVRQVLSMRQAPESRGIADGNPAHPATGARTGATVGAYVTDRILGHGGMGVVWHARRSDGRFEGECAIKFLDTPLATPGREERFRREASLLAKLAHPHIARLLDAGAAADGTPYLALEYVDGKRIDQYCEDRALGIRARVQLFLHVISAVAHAHSRLIVHRDIKPSNVLVNADGQVKLLDFGIAKLLTPDEPTDDLTRQGNAPLTPDYAAPEQILGDAPSTMTDVFQLGLLLYLLLAGVHPTQLSGSREQRLRHLLDGTLPPASELAPIAWRKALRGDLDAILGKALRKSPAERYPTAQAMQDDLQRYLNNEPVLARRGAALYRLRKFTGRNRAAVVAGGLLVGGLAVGLYVVNNQRLVAERRFEQLRHLSSQVFELEKSLHLVQGSTEARQKLLAVSLEYLEGLEADAHGDIELESTLAEAYWKTARIQGVPAALNLGDTAKAEQQLAKATRFIDAVRRRRPRSADALLTAVHIATDRMIVADAEKRGPDALAHARRAAELTDALLALGPAARPHHLDLLVPMSNVAQGLGNLNRYAEAEQAARRVLALTEALPPDEVWSERSSAYSVLANALRLQGEVESALEAIQEALRIAMQRTYTDPARRMIQMYALRLREGYILGEVDSVSLNRTEAATRAFREALQAAEEAAQADSGDAASRQRVATASRELGDLLRPVSPEDALAVYTAALRRVDELPEAPTRRRAEAMLLAGNTLVLVDLGRLEEARARIARAQAIIGRTEADVDRPDPDSLTATVRRAQAYLDAHDGRTRQSVDAYDALVRSAVAGAPDPATDLRAAIHLSGLYRDSAFVHQQSGNPQGALALQAERAKLWQSWQQRLPRNSVVEQQLGLLTPAR